MAAAVWAAMQMSCACVPRRRTAVIKHTNYHNHILLTVYTTSAVLVRDCPGILEKLVNLLFVSVMYLNHFHPNLCV